MVQPEHIESVPIPESFREILVGHLGEQSLKSWETEALIVEAAREHIISRRKAATLLGLTNYIERQVFFERHGLTNEYTLEMLEMDLQALETLRWRV